MAGEIRQLSADDIQNSHRHQPRKPHEFELELFLLK